MDLERVERALKERWDYPYHWGRKQSDCWDQCTSFIYTTYSVKSLLKKSRYLPKEMQNYALNRWYNFWSARAVEEIFDSHTKVRANENRRDKYVDFEIDGIAFDHKTSIYPRGYGEPIEYALRHKKELIEWLYEHQSQEGRKHLKNRLFIVLYDREGAHWKLKAEISELKKIIDEYVSRFNKENLVKLRFGEELIYSDIIWFIKP